jgi:alpha-glucoside transport system substrate-binding protein
MCDLAKQKKVLAWDDADVTHRRPTWSPASRAGTCADGKVYGLPSAVSVKSSSGRPADFSAAG